MKVESYFMVGIGLFFAVIAAIYWFTSYEDGGFLMLIGTTGLGLLPGSYYLWWSHHMKPRVEDDPDATVQAGAGDIGSFPSSSVWPLLFGLGATSALLTLVLGLWLAPISAGFFLWALIGATVESRRGGTV